MEIKKAKRILFIYGCVLSVLLVAVGVALIWSCLDIYNSGPRAYSPQSIGEHFAKIDVLVYVTLGAIAGGIILRLCLPCEKAQPKALRDEKEALARMHKRVGVVEGEHAALIRKEQALRKGLTTSTAILYALLMIHPVIYFCTPGNFTVENLNGDIIRAVSLALGYSLIGLVACFVCKLLCSKSISRELEICKKAIAGTSPKKEAAESPAVDNKPSRRLLAIRATILLVAIVFIIVGIFNGGADDVLLKAIAICTECIGLG